MKILGLEEDYYEIHFGCGNGYDIKSPFYSAPSACDSAYLLMTEKIRKPMYREWVTILKNGKRFKSWRHLEPEIWKEFPVE